MGKTVKPVFSNSRALVSRMKRSDRTLSETMNFYKPNVAKVLEADRVLIRDQVNKILSEMPVDELFKTKLGIRVQPLKDEGYTNIKQLQNVSYYTLEKINGIGPKSAASIQKAVASIVQSVNSNTKAKIDINNRTGASDELIRNLYIIQHGKKVSLDATEYYFDHHDKVTELIKKSRPARNGILWAFSGERNRAQAVEAVNELERIRAQGIDERAKNAVAVKRQVLEVDRETYWEDFRRNSAGYYATLENIKAGNVEKNTELEKNQEIAVKNGLPSDLAVEIGKVELDLKGLKKTLRPYQVYGVQYILNQGSVLLGDDMGLGKTAQAIASMTCLYNKGNKSFFVVCPASVLVNWCREVEDWCTVPFIKIHGADAVQSMNNWINYGGIGITTYETLAKLTLPENYKFDMLVVDEAHYVKNPQAARTQNLLRFRRNTSRALFMTGTPIENKVEEMCFLIGCLKPEVAKEIEGSTSIATADNFRNKVAPVYFRRTKEDVLDELPEKIESEEWCEMTAKEKALYLENLEVKNFAALRQVSWMVDEPEDSSKGKRLKEIVEETVSNGKKVIVFSFFLKPMEKIGRIISETAPVYGPVNGSVSPANRQQIIDDFTNAKGGAVLLSQIQAGGTGLNIQAASVIILCEPQLKPSIENQAIARAYRMGQVDTVMVFRLMCEKTVDERIYSLLKGKQEVFDAFADKSVSGEESLINPSAINSMIEEEKKRYNIS